ncbi:hypothetical protein VNO77_44665 [Canavalia gladiata]|uniref:Uncharacterized protein n=1 Tax=Canavalia gladiata TaxID=3824 RepID=A0AAN9PNZ5_CANGL
MYTRCLFKSRARGLVMHATRSRFYWPIDCLPYRIQWVSQAQSHPVIKTQTVYSTACLEVLCRTSELAGHKHGGAFPYSEEVQPLSPWDFACMHRGRLD